jgi:CHAT domain-containing protein
MKQRKLKLMLLTGLLFFSLQNNLSANPQPLKNTSGIKNNNYEATIQQAITALNAGDYINGAEIAKQALVLARQNYGESHFNTLMSLTILGRLYKAQGRYELAEPLYVKIVELCKVLLGEKHPNTLIAMDNLSNLYQSQGRSELAEKMKVSVLALSKQVLGEKHPDTVITMGNLAVLYKENKRYQLAQPLFEQVFYLSKEVFGEQAPNTLIAMDNLASIYEDQRQFQLAQPLKERVLQLSQQVLGDKHPDTLIVMNNLASFYDAQGHYDLAQPLKEQVLQLNKEVLGNYHPNTLIAMNNLGLLYQTTEQWEKATEIWRQMLRAANFYLERLLWGAGEKTRQAYLQQQEFKRNNYLSFYRERHLPEEAFYFSLSRKGLLLRLSSEVSALAKNTADPQIKQQTAQFNQLREQLSGLVFAKNPDKAQIQLLEEKINTLEMQLSQAVSGFKRSTMDITPAQVLDKLQPQQALVDFLVYKQVDLKDQSEKSEQLLALIADKEKGIELISLGDMQPITQAIQAYRKAIISESESRFKKLKHPQFAQQLYQQLWQPLLPYLDNKKTVYVIGDGMLNLLPFKALQNNEGHYLTEQVQLITLNSGRDLVVPTSNVQPNAASIFVNPHYDLQKSAPDSNRQRKTNRTISRGLEDVYFAPLEQTQKEGDVIEQLMQTSSQPPQFYAQLAASEFEINRVRQPRILHLATHGFFMEDIKPQSSSEQTRTAATDSKQVKFIENPLTRAGLALSYANQGIKGIKQADGTDGILTALEVLSLNLEGTQLVTLSACETGLGDIKVGEGVYSLNRAFQEAGAKAVLSTLWSVDDEGTNKFMQSFYRRFLQGMPAQQALQETQSEFIHSEKWRHPFFWATFVMTGVE